MRADDGVPIFL